jgi:hypothetical protein
MISLNTKRRPTAPTALLLLQLLVACAAEPARQYEADLQMQPFVLLPSSNLLEYAKPGSTLRVCIAGDEVTADNVGRHISDVRWAIGSWLSAAEQISNAELISPDDIQFIVGNAEGTCEGDSELKVRFWLTNPDFPGVPAMSGADRLEVWPGGDDPHVILHEIGHHFGLDDTYDGAGGCLPGQPDSVMCEMSRSTTLMDDDVAGVQAAFCRRYPDDCKQPQCEPPERFTWCDTTNESTLEGCCDDWTLCDAQAYENNGGRDDGPWHCATGTAVQCGRGEYGLCFTSPD